MSMGSHIQHWASGASLLGSRIAQQLAPAWHAVLDGIMPRRCLLCGAQEVVEASAEDASAGVDVCVAHRISQGLFGQGLFDQGLVGQGLVGQGDAGSAPFGPEPLVRARCNRCLRQLPPGILEGVSCRLCRRDRPSFQAVAAAFDYGHPGVSDWLLRLKHGGRPDLAPPLARMALLEMQRAVLHGRLTVVPGPGDLLVPVPLHAARLAERGYNQAALVARAFSRSVGAHVLPVLDRSRSTFVQGELAAPSRRLNVRGAFRAVPFIDLRAVTSKGQRVWLVDDVMTTGSTASACAAALRRVGAGDVRVVVLARA